MNLSNEDSLRLNVLLRQNPLAIRIDDSRLTLSALTSKGEAKVELNPNCREENYLKQVRQLLSTHVLGSPGGYPVYLKRWTRLGQSRDDSSLERLLLLGEPEAVVAVVNSPDIGHDLATRAWWAYPTAETARQLLHSRPVAEGALGKEVAAFLMEFLPFETEHLAAIETVRLILQPGLIDAKTRSDLWKRAKRKQSFYIGFLHSVPDELPEDHPPHPQFAAISQSLSGVEEEAASYLLKLVDGSGQTFLKTMHQVIQKLPNQDAVVELLGACGNYLHPVRPDAEQYREIDEIEARAAEMLSSERCNKTTAGLQSVDNGAELLKAMLALSMLSEYVAAPIFGHTDAIGTVMRRKLKPVTDPIAGYLAVLNPTLKA